jgi:hypothetical protein
VLLVVSVAPNAGAQWQCLYATYDDDACPSNNATGHNTFGVGVIKQDMFIALVMTRGTRCFMIPYVNADSTHGRRYSYGYGGTATAGIYQTWSDGGFDQVAMFNVFSIVATPDSLIYVANNNNPATNNDPDHNILVFKYARDTITVVPPYPRITTGSNGLYGLALDASKRVYVCNDTTTGQTQDIKIYRPAAQWSPTHTETPLRTIDLPDGIYKGITVSPDGSGIFVCDYTNRKVLKYTGSVTAGYTLASGFNFQLNDVFAGTSRAKPISVAYLSVNNILAVACDSLWGGSNAYEYGRIYLVNPNNGNLISNDTSLNRIDAAAWNFAITGGYNIRTCGHGNASGYTSTYDVKFDENKNLYTQSNYGWTVDKWRYNGTLPIIASVEQINGETPGAYKLQQNYPNPFNPTTSIEFAIFKSGHVTLKVYDLLGKEIATLVDEEKTAGSYRATFSAQDLASGTYFYILRSGGYMEMRKMLVLK